MSVEHSKSDTGRAIQPAASLVAQPGLSGALAETLRSTPGGAAQCAANTRIQQSPYLLAQRKQIQSLLGGMQAATQMKEGVPVNDDAALEAEADAMGERALQVPAVTAASQRLATPFPAVAQCTGVFTIDHYDFNPLTGNFKDQAIANARFGPALVQFVNANLQRIITPSAVARTERQLARARTQLAAAAADYANWADLNAGDVDALADAVVAHLLPAPGANTVPAELRRGVLNALVYGLPAAASDNAHAADADKSELTANEIIAYEQLIGACATTSRSKGTVNTVAVGDLGAVAGLDTAFATLRQRIIDRNAELFPRLDAEYDLLFTKALGADAGHGMGIRSMHMNGAGWLPPGAAALPVTLATLRGQINTAYYAAYTNNAAVRTPIEAMPRATQKLQRAAIRAGLVANAVGGLSQRDKRKLIWGSYAESMGPLVNYVEFNLASRINRLMYDYVNGGFYITAHYNWYKGYNPFFLVTGSAD